jgi:hypothetical protein
MIDALKAQWKGDRLVKKNSTVAKIRNEIFKQPQLTIGLDLGDRTSHYCILDETGHVILEDSLPTGNRNSLPLGQPTVDPDGPRSDRG